MIWEYVTVEFVAAGFERPELNDDYRATMNRMGADGWELVTATGYTSPTAGVGDAVILFFKRPAPTAG